MSFIKYLKKNKFFVFIFFLIIILSVTLFFTEKEERVFNNQEQSVIEKKKFDYDSVLNIIEAESYCVYDILENKILFAKNEHKQLPLASITKLMSGLVVLDIMPETTIITIDKEDIKEEGDSGLLLGERWQLKDLLDYTLITSSNDGMHAISSSLDNYQKANGTDTISIMNERAKTFGLNDTYFSNVTGLDIDKDVSGAYSSAYDMALFLEKILDEKPELLLKTNKDTEEFVSINKIRHIATNTNISIDKLPNLIGSKTGFTNLAGGNLAVVFDAGFMHPIVVVVLGSTIDGRFNDVVNLSKITLEKLSE